jgi:hypothetical protein
MPAAESVSVDVPEARLPPRALAGHHDRLARTTQASRDPALGQASVELVALLPLALAVALAVGQVLAAGAARELAGNAAEAGAMAIVQGEDPRAAARDAIPDWSARRVTVRVVGRSVEVRVRPRAVLPGLAGPLTAGASADAGPLTAGASADAGPAR